VGADKQEEGRGRRWGRTRARLPTRKREGATVGLGEEERSTVEGPHVGEGKEKDKVGPAYMGRIWLALLQHNDVWRVKIFGEI
jgi:hypothetical protein